MNELTRLSVERAESWIKQLSPKETGKFLKDGRRLSRLSSGEGRHGDWFGVEDGRFLLRVPRHEAEPIIALLGHENQDFCLVTAEGSLITPGRFQYHYTLSGRMAWSTLQLLEHVEIVLATLMDSRRLDRQKSFVWDRPEESSWQLAQPADLSKLGSDLAMLLENVDASRERGLRDALRVLAGRCYLPTSAPIASNYDEI